MCLYPTLIKNRKYTKNKKNGGQVPAVVDLRTEYVPVGCGNCLECRKQKAREWQVRLLEDIKTNKNGKFITLTFSNESIKKIQEQTVIRTDKTTGRILEQPIKNLHGYDKDNAIATKAIRLFNERHRKKYKKALRHWLVTEIGHKGTQNIHLHGIIWTDKPLEEIEALWQYGFIWKGYKRNGKIINYVNAQTVNYIVKYINKIDLKHKEYKSKILTSPGIGANYINTHNATKNKFNDKNTQDTYRTSTGHTINMPIYWRNKLYTDTEKERLWIHKLDKLERWVDGQKIDISQNEDKYNKVIIEARRKNTQLGYGGKTNYNRKQYEEAQREIMNTTRIKKASGGVLTQNIG